MHVRARSTALSILGGSVRQTLAGEPPLAARAHDKREPEQGRQLLDTSLQRQDLLAKF